MSVSELLISNLFPKLQPFSQIKNIQSLGITWWPRGSDFALPIPRAQVCVRARARETETERKRENVVSLGCPLMTLKTKCF